MSADISDLVATFSHTVCEMVTHKKDGNISRNLSCQLLCKREREMLRVLVHSFVWHIRVYIHKREDRGKNGKEEESVRGGHDALGV